MGLLLIGLVVGFTLGTLTACLFAVSDQQPDCDRCLLTTSPPTLQPVMERRTPLPRISHSENAVGSLPEHVRPS